MKGRVKFDDDPIRDSGLSLWRLRVLFLAGMGIEPRRAAESVESMTTAERAERNDLREEVDRLRKRAAFLREHIEKLSAIGRRILDSYSGTAARMNAEADLADLLEYKP